MDTNNDHQVSGTERQRPATEVLADAIRVLTEAARLRQPEMRRDADGVWREHPTHTRRADWAEFVTQALAGAAANVGSVDAALAGRPGSWEADAVRNLLHSTVGYDEQYLFEHRTEPVHVVVDVEQILTDLDIAWLYDDAEAALDQLEGDATAGFDYTPYYWTYIRKADGQFVADDPSAPPWSIEAWRASLAATEHAAEEWLDELEQYLLNGTARGASVMSAAIERADDGVIADADDPGMRAPRRRGVDGALIFRVAGWPSRWRGVHSAVTSATAVRAEGSSTMVLLPMNAAMSAWRARLLTARG